MAFPPHTWTYEQLTSTLLSLLVIPAVFTGVDDLGQAFGRGFRRLTGGGRASPASPLPSPSSAPSPAPAAPAGPQQEH